MAKAKVYKNRKGITLYLSGHDLENLKLNHLDTLLVQISDDGHCLKMCDEKEVKI